MTVISDKIPENFVAGLEGVVAFTTEIAEPDKDGGALRYRGVDIEDLVGQHVTFGDVWALLVDGEFGHGLPPAEPFPLDALPLPVRQLAEEAASAIGCDPAMVVGPALAIAGGLIGRSASLRLGNNRFTSSCVYQANVAGPGDGKSPALAYALPPVEAIDRELAAEFAEAKAAYRDELTAAGKGR